MRLIEKECPNCGAGVSFTPEDKSCKCEYCKREFEIERDTDKAKTLSDQFNLSELKAPLKVFSKVFGLYTIGSFITSIFIFLIFAVIMILVIFGIINRNSKQSIFNDNSEPVNEVSDLSTRDYDAIDLKSKLLIMKNKSNLEDIVLKGSPKRENLYVVSNDEENIIISVYKTTYQNFFEKENTYTIYIPVKFEDVESSNNTIAFSLGDGEIIAPEYYFNLEHSEFVNGYQELDILYKEVIEPYKNEYKIEEK